ncbi:MmpS family transport accessory protein [Saccharopolyspora sp. NPDC002686]|uniref:MmpS family transport accessory protein n=1 Tax=Saccharopolyspora sp. NPDC002686 TaxID=3154541 RepID=UPI00331EE7DE
MHAVAQPRNGFGTTGFVLGLVGLIFSFIPIIGVIAWPLVILGLIFGILGFNRARKGVATNSGLAITGIVLSAIGLVVCIVWAAAFGKAADDINRNMQQLEQGKPAAPPIGEAPADNSSAQPRTVVYEVTGSGKALNITYTTDGMTSVEQQQDAALPFTKEISLPPEAFQMFSVSAQNAGNGTISCKITVDGKVLKEASSNGQYSVVMCNGDVKNW